MTTPASNFIRWAGLSAMVAGLIFAVVGLIHPPQILSSVTTGTWIIVHSLTIAMSFFGVLGIAGICSPYLPRAAPSSAQPQRRKTNMPTTQRFTIPMPGGVAMVRVGP